MMNPKIGVFICECGEQIAGVLDLETLTELAAEWPGVAYAGQAPYWCSPDGRERLQTIIRAEGLERVVVAGCSPRTHRRLFQETVAQGGLPPDLLGLANIREGCAWPHRATPEAATARAWAQLKLEVARLAALNHRPPAQAEITQAALVLGGGIAGMTAALELADAGIPVTLVERAVTLGGRAINDSVELESELAVAVQAHPKINLLLNSQIIDIGGSVGAYHARVVNERYGPFGAIIIATGIPDEETKVLARLLRLPQDEAGFLAEWRVRLRPDQYLDRGIYVCGAVHYPCDMAEMQFQAFSAASRALRHLHQRRVTAPWPVAQVDPEKCNGCSDCYQVCPFAAVTMAARSAEPDQRLELVERLSLRTSGITGGSGFHAVDPRAGEPALPQILEGLSLSIIDPLLCTGCGNCVSVCPVGAVTVNGWTDAQLEAQLQVVLGDNSANGRAEQWGNGEPRILIFACEWSGYAAAELAGAQKLTYPANVRMIRLDCSGRLQPGLILKAFELGAAGVLVLGCPSKLCHYERGNERAAAVYEQVQALANLLGFPGARLQLAWIPPDDGLAFAELVTGFVKGVKASIEADV